MQIAALYSFNDGKKVMEEQYAAELKEIYDAIKAVNAEDCITKKSKESRRKFAMLYAPKELNKAFKAALTPHGWNSLSQPCDYPTEYYIDGYKPSKKIGKSSREMDFVKNRVGIEIQFGKYSFMVYNVAAKMTIFSKLNHIDVGVEIVPVKELANRMSSGVSYFEQFAWDLQRRGTADIDIPVLIIGITSSAGANSPATKPVSYTHLTLPTNREV